MTNSQLTAKDQSRLLSSLKQAGFRAPLSLNALAGDASLRRYVRVFLPEEKTLVATLLPMDAPAAEAGAKAPPERFLQVDHLLRDHNIPVPEILAYHDSEGVYLQEDLGDRMLATAFSDVTRAERRKLYAEATRIAQKISTIPRQDFCPVFPEHLIQQEFQHFHDEIMLPQKPPDTPRAEAIWRQLSALIAQGSYATSHRDFHARNLMTARDGLVVIDFQDLFFAPAGYDLVSLTRDAYIHFSEADQDSLEQDWEGCARLPAPIETKSQWLDLVGLQRNLKAAGRFAWFDRVRGDNSYLPDVPRLLWLATQALHRLPVSEAHWLAYWIEQHTPLPIKADIADLLVQ